MVPIKGGSRKTKDTLREPSAHIGSGWKGSVRCPPHWGFAGVCWGLLDALLGAKLANSYNAYFVLVCDKRSWSWIMLAGFTGPVVQSR